MSGRMAVRATPSKRVLMLGTFGFQPKATMRARALGMAAALQACGWDVLVGTTPWDYRPDAGRHWVECGVRVANTRVVRPALWPLAVAEMLRWQRVEQPALVHVFKPKGFGDLAGRVLRRRAPLVLDMDDWEGDGGWNDTGLYGPVQRRVFDWQERTLPARARSVTVASRELERRAIDLGVPPDHVHYIPNGLTAERIEQLATATRPLSDARGPRLLLYTRFVEFQPSFIVAALARVRSRFADVGLVVAGSSSDGVAEMVLMREAGRAGLSAAITCLGWIAPESLGSLARSCELAIHPFDDTRLNRSKCSVKLLELMAAGIPVLTTRVGENAQYVEHGRSGWLVEPGDPEAFGAAAVQLLDDNAARRALGVAGAERASLRYGWDRLIDRLLAAYGQALGAPAAVVGGDPTVW